MSPKQIRKDGRLLFVVTALLGGIAGCTSEQSDVEHLEHHIPEHKPQSFSAAVDQVRQRHRKIQEDFQTAEITPLKRELVEMVDIIGWLPELAADSSMTKHPWDKASEAARQLATIYHGATTALIASPRARWPDDERTLESIIQTLAAQTPSDDVK